MNPDYQARLAEADKARDIKAAAILARLDKERPLLPIKSEILKQIDSFIRILDLSNEWFLRSRFEKDPERKKIAQMMWGFYDKRSSLIVSELEGNI